MIYYMSTKTLVKEFAKDHTPDEVLECDLISFSSRIIRNKTMLKISFSQSALFGLESLDNLTEMEKQRVIENNINVVRKELVSDSYSLNTLNNVISESLVFPDKIFIILSSPNEYKTGYPYYLSKVIEKIYKYPVIDYTKYKYKTFEYNPKEVLSCLERYKAEVIFDLNTLSKIIELPKKEKKKLLKAIGEWEKGLDEDEIDEIIERKTSKGLPFRN